MGKKHLSSGSFKYVINEMCLEIKYLISIYKKNLALTDVQWLICHKTQLNQNGIV